MRRDMTTDLLFPKRTENDTTPLVHIGLGTAFLYKLQALQPEYTTCMGCMGGLVSCAHLVLCEWDAITASALLLLMVGIMRPRGSGSCDWDAITAADDFANLQSFKRRPRPYGL